MPKSARPAATLVASRLEGLRGERVPWTKAVMFFQSSSRLAYASAAGFWHEASKLFHGLSSVFKRGTKGRDPAKPAWASPLGAG